MTQTDDAQHSAGVSSHSSSELWKIFCWINLYASVFCARFSVRFILASFETYRQCEKKKIKIKKRKCGMHSLSSAPASLTDVQSFCIYHFWKKKSCFSSVKEMVQGSGSDDHSTRFSKVVLIHRL